MPLPRWALLIMFRASRAGHASGLLPRQDVFPFDAGKIPFAEFGDWPYTSASHGLQMGLGNGFRYLSAQFVWKFADNCGDLRRLSSPHVK